MERYIPDKVNNFNVYAGTATAANKLIGVTDEVTLINLQNTSETLSLAGTAGEINSPTVGQYQSMEIEINFSNIAESSLKVAAMDNVPIIFRSAQEFINPEDNTKSLKNRTITVRGMTKGINFGTLKKGGYGKPSIKKEVTYYKEVIDGETVVEIDKFNGRSIIGGIDQTKDIMDYI
ncbi:MAG: phage major tail tube protein [Lachnospiraceae bacterium]|nr:phage major tail tube protein [Lachnospiraceae bacterium]MBO5145457.1 phage major tail tube protein [Lachnospiraceae bacterium]